MYREIGNSGGKLQTIWHHRNNLRSFELGSLSGKATCMSTRDNISSVLFSLFLEVVEVVERVQAVVVGQVLPHAQIELGDLLAWHDLVAGRWPPEGLGLHRGDVVAVVAEDTSHASLADLGQLFPGEGGFLVSALEEVTIGHTGTVELLGQDAQQRWTGQGTVDMGLQGTSDG